MKKLVYLVLLFCLTSTLSAEVVDGLETAIMNCASEIDARVSPGSKIIVLPISCDSTKMANYLNKKLSLSLMSNGQLKIFDREKLDQILSETELQLIGDVDDQSALVIGRKLGAQAIVSGKFVFLGNSYNFQTRVLFAETEKHQFIDTQSIASDMTIEGLMADGADDKAVLSSNASSTTEGAENNSDAPLPQKDFSIAQRIGAAALNPIGLGSFLMGDIGGGILIAATSAMSPFLIATVDNNTLSTTLLGFAAAEVIGIFRAATFHKPGLKDTAELQSGFNIAVLPSFSASEQSTVKLMYTVPY